MMDSPEREAAPPPETITAYIADMLEQLARMADGVGQAGWARQIRLAAAQPQPLSDENHG
jgi:hypothetical protein